MISQTDKNSTALEAVTTSSIASTMRLKKNQCGISDRVCPSCAI